MKHTLPLLMATSLICGDGQPTRKLVRSPGVHDIIEYSVFFQHQDPEYIKFLIRSLPQTPESPDMEQVMRAMKAKTSKRRPEQRLSPQELFPTSGSPVKTSRRLQDPKRRK